MAKPEKAFLELVAGCLKVNKPRDDSGESCTSLYGAICTLSSALISCQTTRSLNKFVGK